MAFVREQIEQMKQWCREADGQEIDDHEACEAWQRLCDFFRLLMKWDEEDRARRQTDDSGGA